MGKLLKFLHVLSGAVLIGALASSLLIAGIADQIAPTEFAAMRRALALICNALVLPALLLTLVFGALLLLGRPALIYARWVWAKAAIGTCAATIAIFLVLPAVNQAAALARTGIEAPSFMALAAALRSDLIGELALLGLALAAAVLGVWRPPLGKGRSES
jgi:hypothetical protein